MASGFSTYTVAAFYTSAALWNLCMGMLQVLLPLYALSLGYSILEISSLVALPVAAEIVTRFFGSALSDRFGERGVLKGCYFLMVLAALALSKATDYRLLLLAQTLAYFSRSSFWAAIQSLASQLGGPSLGKRLGRLSASNYSGSLIGQSFAGVAAAFFGYHTSFVLLISLTALCTFLGFLLPRPEAKSRDRSIWKITAGIGTVLRYRRAWLAITASYAAAIPLAVTVTVYPLYLAYLEFGEQWIGASVSLRALGPILIGLLIGSWVTIARQKWVYAVGMAGLGLSLFASGLTHNFFLLGLCIFFLGSAGAIMDLLNQVQATEWSQAGDRTVAMASMGLGWNLCPFFTPLIVGWVAEVQGFRVAFVAAGALLALAAAGTGLWYRWLGAEAYGLKENRG
ncbi:MAG: MFS transporter, partial [Deltaproteobacteria bacterium]|nr:MFS transporter [Deltaproteobacteria bacterium]